MHYYGVYIYLFILWCTVSYSLSDVLSSSSYIYFQQSITIKISLPESLDLPDEFELFLGNDDLEVCKIFHTGDKAYDDSGIVQYVDTSYGGFLKSETNTNSTFYAQVFFTKTGIFNQLRVFASDTLIADLSIPEGIYVRNPSEGFRFDVDGGSGVVLGQIHNYTFSIPSYVVNDLKFEKNPIFIIKFPRAVSISLDDSAVWGDKYTNSIDYKPTNVTSTNSTLVLQQTDTGMGNNSQLSDNIDDVNSIDLDRVLIGRAYVRQDEVVVKLFTSPNQVKYKSLFSLSFSIHHDFTPFSIILRVPHVNYYILTPLLRAKSPYATESYVDLLLSDYLLNSHDINDSIISSSSGIQVIGDGQPSSTSSLTTSIGDVDSNFNLSNGDEFVLRAGYMHMGYNTHNGRVIFRLVSPPIKTTVNSASINVENENLNYPIVATDDDSDSSQWYRLWIDYSRTPIPFFKRCYYSDLNGSLRRRREGDESVIELVDGKLEPLELLEGDNFVTCLFTTESEEDDVLVREYAQITLSHCGSSKSSCDKKILSQTQTRVETHSLYVGVPIRSPSIIVNHHLQVWPALTSFDMQLRVFKEYSQVVCEGECQDKKKVNMTDLVSFDDGDSDGDSDDDNDDDHPQYPFSDVPTTSTFTFNVRHRFDPMVAILEFGNSSITALRSISLPTYTSPIPSSSTISLTDLPLSSDIPLSSPSLHSHQTLNVTVRGWSQTLGFQQCLNRCGFGCVECRLNEVCQSCEDCMGALKCSSAGVCVRPSVPDDDKHKKPKQIILIISIIIIVILIIGLIYFFCSKFNKQVRELQRRIWMGSNQSETSALL